ncbi:MAG: WD40 repeat domain-containing protein [Promethearchaeota archaeon]|nr:MAG: WD40 repeat domain-containing protein [Candidatus Lokiarchaeota archaeon]
MTLKVKELWNFKYNEPILGIELGDINNNGQTEIVAFTKGGIVLILSLKGDLLHKELISKDSPIWHSRIYDIDKDGENELILGGMDGLLRVFKPNITYDLITLWNHKFGASISGILIDDINNDNLDELIAFSLDKTMRTLNPLDGRLLWGQVFEEGIGDAIVFLDDKNLNKKEILACGNDGTIRNFDGNDGKLLWFKRFFNKMRCISYLNSIEGLVILCGGDDKKLHFIQKKTLKELKIKEFNDYVWKCISYPFQVFNNVIVSSYSFAYFDNPIENIEFTSNLVCINEFLNVKWEIKGTNIESLRIIENHNEILIIAGTTQGEFIIIEEKTGKKLFTKNNNSCINMIQFLIEKALVFTCHDNGTIITYKLEEDSN